MFLSMIASNDSCFEMGRLVSARSPHTDTTLLLYLDSESIQMFNKYCKLSTDSSPESCQHENVNVVD